MSHGPGPCPPPSAGPEPPHPGTGTGCGLFPAGRVSLLVLLFLGQPRSAQRAGPRQRRGAAGRSPHLRGGCDSEQGGPGPARPRCPDPSPARAAALPRARPRPAGPRRPPTFCPRRGRCGVAFAPATGGPRPRSFPPSSSLSSPPSGSGRAQGAAGTGWRWVLWVQWGPGEKG